jgi:hypothetical protein
MNLSRNDFIDLVRAAVNLLCFRSGLLFSTSFGQRIQRKHICNFSKPGFVQLCSPWLDSMWTRLMWSQWSPCGGILDSSCVSPNGLWVKTVCQSCLTYNNIPFHLDKNGEKVCACLDSEQRKPLCTSNHFSCEYKTALRLMELLKQEECLPSKHEPLCSDPSDCPSLPIKSIKTALKNKIYF